MNKRRHSNRPGFGITEAIASIFILSFAILFVQRAFITNRADTKQQSLSLTQQAIESDIRAALEDPNMIKLVAADQIQLFRPQSKAAGGQELIADSKSNRITYFDGNGDVCLGSTSGCPFGVQLGLNNNSGSITLVYRIAQNPQFMQKSLVLASIGVPGKLEVAPTFKFSNTATTGDFAKYGYKVPPLVSNTLGIGLCDIHNGEWMRGKDNLGAVSCWKLIKLGESDPLTGQQALCPQGMFAKGFIYSPTLQQFSTEGTTDGRKYDLDAHTMSALAKSNAVIPQCEYAFNTLCPEGYSLVGISSLDFFKEMDASTPSRQKSKCVFTYADVFEASNNAAKRCPKIVKSDNSEINYVYDAAAHVCRKPTSVATLVDARGSQEKIGDDNDGGDQ